VSAAMRSCPVAAM